MNFPHKLLITLTTPVPTPVPTLADWDNDWKTDVLQKPFQPARNSSNPLVNSPSLVHQFPPFESPRLVHWIILNHLKRSRFPHSKLFRFKTRKAKKLQICIWSAQRQCTANHRVNMEPAPLFLAKCLLDTKSIQIIPNLDPRPFKQHVPGKFQASTCAFYIAGLTTNMLRGEETCPSWVWLSWHSRGCSHLCLFSLLKCR